MRTMNGLLSRLRAVDFFPSKILVPLRCLALCRYFQDYLYFPSSPNASPLSSRLLNRFYPVPSKPQHELPH